MKTTKPKKDLRRLRLCILSYGNVYYVKRIAKLEKMLAKQPRELHIDLIGAGEMPADAALLIRSVLMRRSPATRLVTHAHSSLSNSSVLVWLLGDTRLIREDAWITFRSTDLPEDAEIQPDEPLRNTTEDYHDEKDPIDLEEADYARVLELIDAYLPVNEMVDRLIGVPVLRQFGLVDSGLVEMVLAMAFAAGSKSGTDGESASNQTLAHHDSLPTSPGRQNR